MVHSSQVAGSHSEWLEALDTLLDHLEQAETELANTGPGRKSSGSFYTPADVVAHFWQLFWRHHNISTRAQLACFLEQNCFIEPAVGSGMFLFGLIRSLAGFGLGPADLASLRFHAIDINPVALDFVRGQLARLEAAFSFKTDTIVFSHANFLVWVRSQNLAGATFIGNPPFVPNPRGSRWKNQYADFVEAILSSGPAPQLSLILPVSVCFSRDYTALRGLLKDTGQPLSVSSYDNIPDCLFKFGKPESTNSNKANSQRCSILNLGGSRSSVIESSALLRWTTKERQSFLMQTPHFHDCAGFDIRRQIPRPKDEHLIAYLQEAALKNSRRVADFLSPKAYGSFSVGGVARNYIGFRDYEASVPGVIPVRAHKQEAALILLQVLGSAIFYKYWRSFGDGFHVTNDLIHRFPISRRLLQACEENLSATQIVWAQREQFAKIKRNAGRIIKSYDFSQAFPHMA